MGRMHNTGKGISRACLPYRRSVPSWLKATPAEVEEQIERLARKGLRPSQIGVLLRDSQGIAQVRRVTGNKIVRILKKKARYGTGDPGGSVPLDQEGGQHSQAFGTFPQGHRWQIPFDFGRVAYSSFGSLLQNQPSIGSDLALRIVHGISPRLLNIVMLRLIVGIQ
ncbi:40S ribosomal protein S13 [Aphelenchoides besseyi]|nr:40S ribosomal protein S13 [Aphelenchoides besseyi]KAI6232265.1 40S ribosomal protein S13 [Aphelenchoides besseyi]